MINKYFSFLCSFSMLFIALSYSQNIDSTTTETDNEPVEQPKVKYQPRLVFPEMALQAGLEVSLDIKVAIGKNGKPYKTVITKRVPEFVYMFDEEVRRWAMDYEFFPGINKKGEAVRFWVTIPVRFRLRDFEPPSIVEQPHPEHPRDAIDMGMEGWVGVAVLVDKNGMRDGRPLIVSREPSNTEVFDDAAIDVAMNTTFKPASVKGNNTNGWIFMKVQFTIPSKER